MGYVLKNFERANATSLQENDAKIAYEKISDTLTKAHIALIRFANSDEEKERFRTWFGDKSGRKKVQDNISKIHNVVVNKTVTLVKEPYSDKYKDTYAYVFLSGEFLTIHLCEAFWKAANRKAVIDTTVGTLIHEISHLVTNTKDYCYGQQKCKELAIYDANKASENADSYEYYCESFLC